jgi:hypothetical protein
MQTARYCCQILMKLEFSTHFPISAQTLKFSKIHPLGVELCRADGRTDMANLTVAFRNSANSLTINNAYSAIFFFIINK